MNILDLSNLLSPTPLTKLSLGATWFLSAKTFEEEIEIRSIKTIIRECEMLRLSLKKKGGGAKVLAKEPNPRVHHLVFLLKLGSENLRATPRR